MIRDLSGSGRLSAAADVVVIGGGTAGLLTSVRLAEAGKRVICLESGGLHQSGEEHPLNEVVHLKSLYAGAAKGRFRCIGGTSTRWGGALIPFQDADLRGAGWPIGLAELQPYVEPLEEIFQLSPGSYDLAELSVAHSHVARLAKWPPFKKRNVYNLFSRKCAELQNLTIWLNATACTFEASFARLDQIVARSQTGDEIVVSAPHFIIAAGAIETTRLALLLEKQNESAVSTPSNTLGHYFSDHLSVAVGELEVTQPAKLNRHVGFRFEANGTMRNLRFELAPDAPIRGSTPPSFVHVGFETDGRGGFDALRGILQQAQKRRLPEFADLIGLMQSLPWLARALWSRYVHHRLLFPQGARLIVHAVIEQTPSRDNAISLANQRQDLFGTPLAAISWQVQDSDKENLARTVDAFAEMWAQSPLAAYARFRRRPTEAAAADLVNGGGIYHPTGSTRLAASPELGVVDANLRMFSVPNVQLLSTSVLPTGGGANPTMMLLLLALRAVDQLAGSKL